MSFLRRLGGISIRWKLAGLMTFVSGLALVAVSSALLFQDARVFERAYSEEISALAEVIAANTEVALAFEDEQSADEILQSLSAQPRVQVARIFAVDGSEFAAFSRPGTRLQATGCGGPGAGTSRGGGELIVVREMVWQSEIVGQLCIVAGTEEIRAHLIQGVRVAGVVLLAAIGLTFLTSIGIQRLFSRPILELAEAAHSISEKNYDVRVTTGVDDELGLLARTFNRMVGEIRARDVALVEAHHELEHQVCDLQWEIAERERAEEALRTSETALHQAQKMEAVGLLAGGIAHDFNNLMTAVVGYSALIVEDLQPSPEIRSKAEQIREAGERAADLTKQLLAFSRKQILEPQIIDLNDTLSKMQEILERLVGEDTRFKLDLRPHLGVIRADPAQIEQVLLNLVVNARDAISAGGVIEISTGVQDRRLDRLESAVDGGSPSSDVGRFISLAVSDNGCGMDAATKRKIFEPFFTTKSQGKGTGLGLSTVFGIVKQSHGDVEVESELGEGTTITILLPEVEREAVPDGLEPVVAAPFDVEEAEYRSQPRSGTILIVEDQLMVRELAIATLESEGYSVLQADSGAAAIELSADFTGKIDLLLTDIVMPGINGYDASRRVTESHPETRTIFMSGYTERDIVRQGVLIEGVELIQKPFAPEELRRRVASVLELDGLADGEDGRSP